MNGGFITGNIAKESGGGIHIDGLKQSNPWGTAPAKLMMNNGTITGNIAAKGGGVCVESLQEFTRAENTKLCNNTASEAGDDIYNDDGILQLGSVGSDWTLDACEYPITGWYQDNKGQRWQGHAGEPYAVGYEGIGTGIKAAHGPYYGYTVNYYYGNMVEADHGSAALNEDIPYSSADNAIYNDRNYSLNHVEGGDKFVSAEASSNVVDVYYDLLYTVFCMLPDMKKWTDNPEDAWYYEAVQEATNEHDYTRDETAVESWTLVKEHRDWAALELGWAANGGASAPQGETETQGLPDGI